MNSPRYFSSKHYSFYSRINDSCLLSLPDLTLVKILQYIDLSELLISVTKTCKRLNEIINCNYVLWRHISFEFEVIIPKDTLERIINHSIGFWTFLIPFAELKLEVPEIDWLFVNGFCRAKELYWLDLTNCKISTLCFLKCLPNIQILNVSGCNNLVNDDFLAIQNCTNIDQLYVSFTEIKPSTIVVLTSKLCFTVLESCAIPLGINDIQSIFSASYTTLLYVQLTLADTIDEKLFRQNFCQRYIDCSIQIYKKRTE